MIPFAIPRQHTLTCQSSQLATIVTACRLCSSDQKQNHKFTQHPKPIPPSCLLDRVHSWSANRSNKVFTYFCCWRFGPTALCLLPSDSSVYLHFPFTTRGAQVALLKPVGFFSWEVKGRHSSNPSTTTWKEKALDCLSARSVIGSQLWCLLALWTAYVLYIT